MVFMLKYKWIIAGLAIGAAAGYLYYRYVGCATGTCAITSKPVNSTAYGAMMGGLLFSLFPAGQKKSKSESEEPQS
jgi:phage shock protein E